MPDYSSGDIFFAAIMYPDIQHRWIESVLNTAISYEQIVSICEYFEVKLTPTPSKFNYSRADLIEALLIECDQQLLTEEVDSVLKDIHPFLLNFKEADKLCYEHLTDSNEALIQLYEKVKMADSKISADQSVRLRYSVSDIWSHIFDEVYSQARWDLEKKNILAKEGIL